MRVREEVFNQLEQVWEDFIGVLLSRRSTQLQVKSYTPQLLIAVG